MSISKSIQFSLCLTVCVCISSCDEDDTGALPIVTGATINAEVGGATQPNQVFIDFSTGKQTAVDRSSWDLGFYNGDEFRVILNSSVNALARPLDKTDLTTVTAEDTIGWGEQLDIDAIFATLYGEAPEWLMETKEWMDDPSGDLTATAIAEISATADNNVVYIINRGKNPDNSQRGWMKLKVNRNDNGYTLQYAEIDKTSFSTLNISKNNDFNFSFVNLLAGTTTVEPGKSLWDFAFTTYTNLLPIDAATSIPYAYKDFVVHNHTGVTTAMIMIDDNTTYESFSAGDLTEIDFSEPINTIGSTWRTIAQPGSGQQTGVKTDRFYVITDADGNVYKLRFTQLLDPVSGERGHPQVEYKLVE